MSYGEINESLLTKKRFEMAEKALPLTRKKKKNTDKKTKYEDKKYYIWQIMRS